MDRGIYTAASGGLLGSRRLDVVGNNLANVNTVGYKAQRLVSREQEFADTLASTAQATGRAPSNPAKAEADHSHSPGVVHIATKTDFSPGPVSNTGNPLHAALGKPNQFFVVNTPQGEAYTRAGNFTLDAVGNLVTPDGLPVLGEGGPITVTTGSARINGSGNVVAGAESLGRLRVVEFENTDQLKRSEGTRFIAEGGTPPQTVEAEVIPESVEMANISVVDAMIEMINAQKSFESYAKTVQTISELNEISLRTARSV